MAAPANHFTAFVERLTADVGTMPGSAEAMADAAGLSRSVRASADDMIVTV